MLLVDGRKVATAVFVIRVVVGGRRVVPEVVLEGAILEGDLVVLGSILVRSLHLIATLVPGTQRYLGAVILAAIASDGLAEGQLADDIVATDGTLQLFLFFRALEALETRLFIFFLLLMLILIILQTRVLLIMALLVIASIYGYRGQALIPLNLPRFPRCLIALPTRYRRTRIVRLWQLVIYATQLPRGYPNRLQHIGLRRLLRQTISDLILYLLGHVLLYLLQLQQLLAGKPLCRIDYEHLLDDILQVLRV